MTTLLAEATGTLERANYTVGVIGVRLTDTQGDVVDLRQKIAGLALLTTVDPAHEPELIEARARLAESEARIRELGAAEQLAQRLAREAKQKAVQAAAQADWAAAGTALDEATSTARALDAMAGQMGELYRRLLAELRTATGHVTRHMVRQEHALLIQPPNLDDTLRLVLSHAGGPPVDPLRALTAAPSLVEAVAGHVAQVLQYRPADTTEPEDSHHE